MPRFIALAALLATSVILGFTIAVNGGWVAASLTATITLAAALLTCYLTIARTAFSVPFAYLAILGVFHLGFVLQLSIWPDGTEWPTWLYAETLRDSLILCAVAFACYGWGVLAFGSLHGPLQTTKRVYAESTALAWAGAVLAGVGLLSLYAGMARLGIWTGSYAESYTTRLDQDPRLFGIGILALKMGFIAWAIAAPPRWALPIVGVFFVAAAPLLMAGFRGPVIVTAIPMLIILHRVRPVPARVIGAVCIAAAMVVMPAVRLVRSTADMPFVEAVRQAEWLGLFAEAGGSIRPLVETHRLLSDDVESYWYGQSYLMALMRVVPNVGVGAEYSIGLGGKLPPNHWLTATVAPHTYRRGGGLGFSGVAEPYLNFGVAGILLFFLAMGYALAQGERLSLRSPFYASVFMVATSALLWTARNDFMEVFRLSAWFAVVCVLVALAEYVLRRPSRRKVVGKNPVGAEHLLRPVAR
ncbi:MAG: O-antigen polysaccharide polymerase Wzy [Planctomycetota bacterium]